MPFEIVRNAITNMCVDAIVNTANPRPVIGSGTDAGIHAKAGPELLDARKKIGDIIVGCSAITAGFDLDAEYVIHTVGPIWDGGGNHEEARTRVYVFAEYVNSRTGTSFTTPKLYEVIISEYFSSIIVVISSSVFPLTRSSKEESR